MKIFAFKLPEVIHKALDGQTLDLYSGDGLNLLQQCGFSCHYRKYMDYIKHPLLKEPIFLEHYEQFEICRE